MRMDAPHSPDLTQAAAAAAVKAGPLVAALAGAVVSLAFLERLTMRGRLIAVLNGFLIAVFVSPAITDLMLPTAPLSVVRGVHFMVGLLGMGLMPVLIIGAKNWLGGWFEALKLVRPHPPASPA